MDCLLVVTLCNTLTKLNFVRDQTAVKKLKIEKAVESKQGNSGLRLKKVHKVYNILLESISFTSNFYLFMAQWFLYNFFL